MVCGVSQLQLNYVLLIPIISVIWICLSLMALLVHRNTEAESVRHWKPKDNIDRRHGFKIVPLLRVFVLVDFTTFTIYNHS